MMWLLLCPSRLSRVQCPKLLLRAMTTSNVLVDKAYVDGSWVSAKSGKTFAVVNPADGKTLANVPDMDAGDVRVAIDSAHQAFESWSGVTARARSSLLRRWFELCQKNKDELAHLLTLEQGKPLSESRGEVNYGLSFIEWFAEEARRVNGEVVPAPASNKQLVFLREPVGVAALITPWNFPNAMITRKAGAALAAGCTCVIKPAEDTPLSALALVKLAEEAGFPKGVINVVTCSLERVAEVGLTLCESDKVAALSFTGSTRVGKLLYRQCASTVKKIGLELGGNAPFIVFDSADIDQAVAGCMAAKFRNAGQTCISTNRVFVQKGVADLFVEKMSKAVKEQLVLGDGAKDGVNMGPIINKRQLERVEHLVNNAKKSGANVVLGGSRHNATPLHFEPTILTDVTPNMECFSEEIFGPVISIVQFDTEEEALRMANDCRVGLAGYFYSKDVGQCWRVAKKLEVGMVGINEGLISCPEAAFGGIKESGIGKEGGSQGIDEYTELKYLCFGNL